LPSTIARLPCTLAPWKVAVVVHVLVEGHVWHDLPPALANRLGEAHRADKPFSITKSDVDSLSPKVWAVLAAHLS
jgi:hypothetical protein